MASKHGKTSGKKVRSLAARAVSNKQARKVKGGMSDIVITKKMDSNSGKLMR